MWNSTTVELVSRVTGTARYLISAQVGGWAFLNSFPQYTPSDDLSIVTALSQFSTPGNALLGAVGN